MSESSDLALETETENEILIYLNSLEIGYFWKNVSSGFFDGKRFRRHASPFAIRGTSDILGWLKPNGRGCAFEVKRPGGGRESEDQRKFKEKSLSYGAIAAVVRSIPETKAVLQSYGIEIPVSNHERAISRLQTLKLQAGKPGPLE